MRKDSRLENFCKRHNIQKWFIFAVCIVLMLDAIIISKSINKYRSLESYTERYNSYSYQKVQVVDDDNSEYGRIREPLRKSETNTILGMFSFDYTGTIGTYDRESLASEFNIDLSKLDEKYKKYLHDEIPITQFSDIEKCLCSDIKVTYYYDNVKKQVARFIRVRGRFINDNMYLLSGGK